MLLFNGTDGSRSGDNMQCYWGLEITFIMQGKTSAGSTHAREGWMNGCARLNTPKNGKPFKITTYSRKAQ